ncbi:MAG: glycosyltransferase family 39 protein [bacterium]|nr:glycosyltransferase family 39 protein [bacterium]
MKKEWSLFVLIILLAGFLRLYNLPNNPPGFFADEASVGYNAYTILKTARDEHGNFLPVFFRAFGEYKNPVMIYSVVPSLAIFGLSETSVRLIPSAYGIITIFLLFLLSKKLFGPNIALPAAFFLAISPWHAHLSRVALEGLSPFIFFAVLSLYLFLVGLNNKKYMFLSFFFWGITTYTYFPARLFVPLFLAGTIFTFKIYQKPKILKTSLLIFFIITLPLVLHLLTGDGLSRWNQVSVFSSNLAPGIVLANIIKLYLNHFTPDFLFQLGDADSPGQGIKRHSVMGLGELYWFQLPLLLISVYYLFKKRNLPEIKILFLWLIIYPLGSVFTDASGPQATRSFIGVIPFQIMSALGLWQLFLWLKRIPTKDYQVLIKQVFVVCFLLVSFLSLKNFLYWHNRYISQAADYWGWQSGPRDIVHYFLNKESNYDELIMSGQLNAPEIFLKFYAPGNCEKCRIGDISLYNPSKKQLFALPPSDLLNSNYKIMKTFYYPDGKISFKIVELLSPSND